MLNHITLMGRLTRDPEMRTTQNGTAVTSFSVACERDYQSGGSERQTDFINCAAWRNTAEFINRNFRKGQMIIVSGRLQSRSWTDRNDNKRTEWEVIAENCYFGEPKRTGDANVTPPKMEELDEDDGDIPF